MRTYQETKIIATLGPASADPDIIRRMMLAGANCFRINFSHGTGETLQPLVDSVRAISSDEGLYIPILADIQGPKIRISKLPQEGVRLVDGQEFVITTRKLAIGSEHIVGTSYSYLPRDVRPGKRVMLADGIIELNAERIEDTDVFFRVVFGGRLFSNQGMNLPGMKLSVETLTQKDIRDLDYIASSDIDMTAISFVRTGDDVRKAREILTGKGNRSQVMAKLERPEALTNLEDILETADGIMIARGDLGVELDFESIPVIQKQLLKRAAVRGIWAVTATQMLVSMTTHTRPTRAEVSDVANAVLDGTDAIMLSEETAAGKNPVLAVEAMAKISSYTERESAEHVIEFDPDIMTFAAGAAGAAVSAAGRLGAKAIVTLAGSGLTALLVSKWRPEQPILSLSSRESTLRRLNVLRGVIPVHIGKKKADIEEQIEIAEKSILEHELAQVGDIFVVAAAVPLGRGGETNTIRFHKIRKL